jgi:MFS family permease
MWNKLNKSMMVCQMAFGLSFYGVMVILTRFFLEDLKYNESETMMIVGAFSAIGPLFAIAGGFIADKFLGAYRSISIVSHRCKYNQRGNESRWYCIGQLFARSYVTKLSELI